MATAPFDIAHTTPGNSDIVSLFPGVERTYRDVVESWLLSISNTYGYPRVPTLTTAQRDAETNWTDGNVIYNDTLGRLQATTSIDPDVWVSLGPEFSSGTRVVLQQTSAPTGYTKVTDAAYNDAALRMVTGTVTPTGGTAAFSTTFASRTPAGTIGGTAITEAQMPSHTHVYSGVYTREDNSGSSGFARPLRETSFVVGTFSTDDPTAEDEIEETGGDETHTHTFTGTAMDFAVKYVDVCVFQKD